MDAIQKLMDEHRIIETALDALAAAASDMAAVPREDLGRFVTFIREYADAYHHGKEEDMLFRDMVKAGVPVDGGPIAVMLAEHDQGRRFLAVLAGIADGEGPLGADEAAAATQAAAGYVNLLRAHIQKEDQILYPMAQRTVPAEAMEAMGREFEEYEAREAAAAEALVAVARDLAGRYRM